MSHASRTEKSDCTVQNRVITLKFTFPYDEYPPTGFCKQTLISRVSTDIAGEFLTPKVLTRLRDIGLPATVTVPEASIDKDHGTPPRKYQIGTAGKRTGVCTKAIAQGVKRTTDKHLRFRVNTTNAPHESATLIRGMYVRHPKSPLLYCKCCNPIRA